MKELLRSLLGATILTALFLLVVLITANPN